MNKIFSTLLVCLLCLSASANTVFTWTGGASNSNWTDPDNWSKSGDVTDATFPQSATAHDVIIPAEQTIYPVLKSEDNATCHYIYFAIVFTNGAETTTSARIKNQHLLTYTEAFCDVKITANRWVRTAAPLKNTFSGDYFVKHQTLDQRAWGGKEFDAQGAVVNGPAEDWHFVEAQYKYSEKGDNNAYPNLYINRSDKGTYYSYYSSNRIIKDDLGSDSTTTFVQQWGNPSNSLKTPIQPAMGFDVWVDYGINHMNDPVTFRFPSGTGWYAYFEDGGHISPRDGESYDRNAKTQGRFALDQSNVKDGKATLTVTRDGEEGKAYSKMFAVGNPAIAYLDIARFIHRNVDDGNIYRYVYTHNEENPDSDNNIDGRGTENIYFYSRHEGDQLYKLTTAVSPKDPIAAGNTNPDGEHAEKTEVAKATRPSFINPAEGFRVFGGGVSYKCAVPELIGIYSSAKATIAPAVCEKYYSNGSLITGADAYSNVEIPMLKRGYVDFDYSVTVTNDPNKVRINNFLNLGSVEATINKEAQTLTIPAGSKITAIVGGLAMSDGDSEKDFWNFTETTTPVTDLLASDKNLNYGSTSNPSETFAYSGTNRITTNVAEQSPITVTLSNDVNLNQGNSSYFVMKQRGSSKITINGDGALITKVVITGTSKNYAGGWLSNIGSIGNNTNTATRTWQYTSGANEVVLTLNSFSSGYTEVRINKIEVTYKDKGTQIRVLNIYGLNADEWSFSDKKHKVYSGVYANNITNRVSKTDVNNDIVLKYSVDDNGAVHINMTPSNCKKILVMSDALKNGPESNKPGYHHDNSFPESCLCESWFAYEGMVSEKPADDGSEFLMRGMNMEGTYGTRTLENAKGYNGVSAGNWYKGMEIARIAGRTNVVTIKGLYPQDKNTAALGQIERRSDAAFVRSDFSQNGNTKAAKNGITITLSANRGSNNGYVEVGQNNTITVTTADETKPIKRITIHSVERGGNYPNAVRTIGDWTASSGQIAVVPAVLAVWQGTETQVVLKNISSTTAEITGIEVNYKDKEGSDYYLLVPAGQLVHVEGSAPAPELDSYFYSHGNAGVRMRTIEMRWVTSGGKYDGRSTGNGYWEAMSQSDNMGCRGTMVTRFGLQPQLSGLSGTIGAILSDEKFNVYGAQYTKHRCTFQRLDAEVAPDDWGTREDYSSSISSSTSNFIDLTFTPDMFQANMADANNEAALAPSRMSSVNNAPVIITAAASEEMVANTMIVLDAEASDEFNPMEDAPLFDVADYGFAFGTLAGNYLVGVNSIASEELIPLFLSKSATLRFSNIATLGEAYLYDAVADTRVLISDTCAYTLEIMEGQQAGRYFIETNIEAPSIETDIENVTPSYGWKPVAYCPANGSLAVACAAEGVSYEVYNVSGQKVAQSAVATTFSGLQGGMYVVNATRGNEMQALKVIVY